jgi:hypothetical protein
MRAVACVAALFLFVPSADADPLTCNLTDYRSTAGLNAAVASDVLTTTWDGGAGQQVRLRLAVQGRSEGQPFVENHSTYGKVSAWAARPT